MTALGERQFELVMERRGRWSWHGSVIERRWIDILGEQCWSMGVTDVGGYWAWTEERLERKLRRVVERRKRELARRDATRRSAIV